MAVSKRLRFEIFRRDNNTCQYCGAKAPDVELVPDHVVPVALGGKDEPSNLVTACDPCNSGKSATPPDAARVAKVSDDALRWAQAIKAASADMLANLAARDTARAAFDEKWTGWSGGKRDALPRPVGWKQSIDSLIAAGLPLPVLLDCMDIAMSTRKIKADDVFRYMCGIAWKEVTKLQEAARGLVTPAASLDEESSACCADQYEEVVAELLEVLTVDERERNGIDEAEAASLELNEDDRFPIASAFDAVLSDLRSNLWGLTHCIDQLVEALPDGIGHQAMKTARLEMYDRLSDPGLITRDLFAEWATRSALDLLNLHADAAYLERLPQAEREAWMAYAETLHNAVDPETAWADVSSDDRTRHAAHHARMSDKGLVHRAMCPGPGNVIAHCSKRAEFWVLLEEPDCCSGQTLEAHGHSMCGVHLELLMTGDFRSSKGETRTARDYKELDNS